MTGGQDKWKQKKKKWASSYFKMEGSFGPELGSPKEEYLGMGIHLYATPKAPLPGPCERPAYKVSIFLAIVRWTLSHLSGVLL